MKPKIKILIMLFAFCCLNACGKEQPKSVYEDAVIEENNDVITEDNANESIQTENDDKDMYQTDILTVQKVGELETLGENYGYTFGTNVLYKRDFSTVGTGEFIVCSWKGDEIGKDIDITWDNEGKYFYEYLDNGEQWYNQDGDKILDTSMYTIDDIYCDDYDYKSERYVVVSSEEKIEGIFDKLLGRFIPNLPVIEDLYDVHWVGNNIWLETENGVEIYNCEGELVKEIKDENICTIRGFKNYIYVSSDSGRMAVYDQYHDVTVEICKILDENGDLLFSYLSRNEDNWSYELYEEDIDKGYFFFQIDHNDPMTGEYLHERKSGIVDESGNLIHDSYYVSFHSEGNVRYLDDTQADYNTFETETTRYYFDDKGYYYEYELAEDDYGPNFELCDLGIRYILDTSHMMAEEPFYNIKVCYINSGIEEEIEHVDNPYVDVFYSKDGNLYSYVDGSLALDGDYNNYFYAYGRIYAENDDLSYDIFEIVEYNPPYEYKSLWNGESLGNIAVDLGELVTEESEIVDETVEEVVVEVTVPKLSDREECNADGFNRVNDINNGLPIYLPNDSGTGLVHDIWKSNLSTDLVIDELVGRGVIPSRFSVEGETIGFTQDIYTVVFTEELVEYIKSLSAEQEEAVMASITLTLCANRGTPAINYVDSSGEPLLTNNYYYDVPVNENTYYYLVENE